MCNSSCFRIGFLKNWNRVWNQEHSARGLRGSDSSQNRITVCECVCSPRMVPGEPRLSHRLLLVNGSISASERHSLRACERDWRLLSVYTHNKHSKLCLLCRSVLSVCHYFCLILSFGLSFFSSLSVVLFFLSFFQSVVLFFFVSWFPLFSHIPLLSLSLFCVCRSLFLSVVLSFCLSFYSSLYCSFFQSIVLSFFVVLLFVVLSVCLSFYSSLCCSFFLSFFSSVCRSFLCQCFCVLVPYFFPYPFTVYFFYCMSFLFSLLFFLSFFLFHARALFSLS